MTDSFNVVELLLAIAGLTGVVGFFWGIYQYRQSRIEKRKDILFELVKEFDKSEEMELAKKILDDFSIEPKNTWLERPQHYTKSNLSMILRSHYKDDITDLGEQEIRESFDTLFDFFDRLGYLYKVGLVKKEELTHFSYYVKRARDADGVDEYVKTYGFRWLSQLPVITEK